MSKKVTPVMKCGGCGKLVLPEDRVRSTVSECDPYVSPCCMMEVIDLIDQHDPAPVGVPRGGG